MANWWHGKPMSNAAIVKYSVLLLFLVLCSLAFSLSAWSQTELAVLFHDDFEDGFADNWDLGMGWRVERDADENFLLNGEGHNWAGPLVDGWMDCVIEAKFKLLTEEGLHLSFRMSERRTSPTERVFARYFLGMHGNGLYLSKQIGQDFFKLAQSEMLLSRGTWYTVKIVLQGTSINIYLDDEMRISFVDGESPLLFGTFAFETLDGSQAQFDDVIVMGEDLYSAQGISWVKTGGPLGGLGYDVRIHPQDKDIMFVTDNPSGVNKSYDAGRTWVQRNSGITTRTGPSGDGTPVFSLTIAPNDPNIVWAGTQNAKGIYKSTDGGETWTKMDKGVTEGNEISFRGFGVDPNNPDIVFAGAEISTGILGREFDRTKGKIYRTRNGGENWECVWEGDNLARFIIIDPTATAINAYGQVYSKTMYASTGIFDREAFNDRDDEPGGVGILKSTDGGDTWRQINKGITNLFVGFLEMHPADPEILFAAAGNNTWWPGGVYRTRDGGENWEQVLSDDIFTVATLSLSDPNVIYAGSAGAFYRSDDGGDTWQEFRKKEGGGYGPPGVRAGVPISAVVDPDDYKTIFVNNYGGGNFKSTDGAQTWADASKGYTGADLRDIAIDKDNPGIVYTIGRSGPFRSFNGGEDWTGIGFPPATEPEWYAIALNPDNPREVLISDEHNGIIFKTEDGGNTWKTVLRHPEASKGGVTRRHGFKTIAYAPSDAEIVYAGMRRGTRAAEGDLPYGPSFGVYKSIDGGDTWTEKNSGLESFDKNINDIVIHPQNPDIAYLGGLRDGVYKTTDGGESWMRMSNGLISTNVQCLAIDPANPEVVYAGLGEGGGIFRSVNGGEMWQEINEGIALQCPSSLLPVGKVRQGISLQAPSTFMHIGGDYYSIPWTSVKSVVIDPKDPKTIYAADFSSGVYMSADGGAYWQKINDGLSTRAVLALDISSSGKVLYAATSGEGVFRLTLEEADLTEIYNARGNVIQSKLLQNYPNPFNPDTCIPYQLAEPGNVTISIYSESGQLMRRLDLGHKASGFYIDKNGAAYWDGKNDHGEKVSSGLYFYTINVTSPAGDFSAARQMTLMK